MESNCNETKGAKYMYRADGMRVKKVDGLTIDWNPADEQHASGWYDENQAVNKDTTRFYYDGQMGMEEDRMYTDAQGTHLDVTRYGVGARGIDLMQLYKDAASQWVKFPLYDGHGNMIATIKRAGTGNNSFTSGDARTYDVWGGIRSGNTSGDPAQRYCASLGHRVDDESEGLIYMRARYYEPWTGRFVSEDKAGSGDNWYTYCGNDPVNFIDEDGNSRTNKAFAIQLAFATIFLIIIGFILLGQADAIMDKNIEQAISKARYFLNQDKMMGYDVGDIETRLRNFDEVKPYLDKGMSAKAARMQRFGKLSYALSAIAGYAAICQAIMFWQDADAMGFGWIVDEFIHDLQ
ncbi:MAG: RHS repeat-associated core domain-containing protein [Fimbriimonadales bacterium]